MFNGTDGYLFPPLRPKEMPMQAHEKALCRTFYIPFEKKIRYRGIPTHMFTYDLGDIKAEPENKCYCREEDECPLKGTMDLFPCVGTPITLSMPHFYNADPSIAEKIAEGMNPNKEKHQIFVKMELVSGVLPVAESFSLIDFRTQANGSASVGSKARSVELRTRAGGGHAVDGEHANDAVPVGLDRRRRQSAGHVHLPTPFYSPPVRGSDVASSNAVH